MGKRKPKDKKVDPRNRRMISAYFDMDKQDEASIVEYNDVIRKDKKLNRNGTAWKDVMQGAISLYRDLGIAIGIEAGKLPKQVIDAIRLYAGLARGDWTVAEELFPERCRALRLRIQSEYLDEIRHDETNRVISEIGGLRKDMVRIENKIRSAPQVEQTDKPRILSVPQFDLPPEDDEDESLFEVKKDETAGERSALNFLASIGNLQG